MRRIAVGAVTLLMLVLIPNMAAANDRAAGPPAEQPVGIQVGCYASSCTGYDPQNAGCSTGALTLESFVEYGIYYEMRYSSACYAVWTRVTTPGTGCLNLTWGQIMTYSERLIYGVQACGGTRWTRMISFEYSVKTCVSHVSSTGNPSYCTQLR